MISAPSGFGKTTLVSEWLAQAQQDAGWLALDEDDNDVVRFLRTWSTAWAAPAPKMLEASVLALLQARPGGAVAVGFWARSPRSWVHACLQRMLGLDDYHVIPAGQSTRQWRFSWSICRRCAGSSSRGPLIRRCRSAGCVRGASCLELRAGDFRFTVQETKELLGRVMQLALSADSMQVLNRRTEGWVTGLHLAGLALKAAATGPVRLRRVRAAIATSSTISRTRC